MTQAALRIGSTPAASQPDLAVIKSKIKTTWEDGDYASFAKYMEPGAIEILDRWNIAPGQRLLDVGCGSGQTAIPAARRGIHVTAIDIASNLITHARERARAEGLVVRLDEGDAEDLPYAGASFDVAITLIGAMFAPRPHKVAAEFARVLRPGGKLYMANWTPHGMPAQMFKCVAGYVPPPPGFIPPVLWGDEETVRQRLGRHFTDIQLTRKMYPQWHYSFTPSEIVEFFRTHFGPVKRAFETIDEAAQETLRQQLEHLYADSSETLNGILTITAGEYLEVIATRR
ncbi:MAG: class I SAM-dependent methyltransferase [Pseudomonadota bacterium]